MNQKVKVLIYLETVYLEMVLYKALFLNTVLLFDGLL